MKTDQQVESCHERKGQNVIYCWCSSVIDVQWNYPKNIYELRPHFREKFLIFFPLNYRVPVEVPIVTSAAIMLERQIWNILVADLFFAAVPPDVDIVGSTQIKFDNVLFDNYWYN